MHLQLHLRERLAASDGRVDERERPRPTGDRRRAHVRHVGAGDLAGRTLIAATIDAALVAVLDLVVARRDGVGTAFAATSATGAASGTALAGARVPAVALAACALTASALATGARRGRRGRRRSATRRRRRRVPLLAAASVVVAGLAPPSPAWKSSRPRRLLHAVRVRRGRKARRDMARG